MTSDSKIETPQRVGPVAPWFGFSSPGRVVRWALYSGGAITCAWFALTEHRAWASNLLSFVTIAYSVIALGVLSKDVQKACAKHGRSVPAWLSVSADMAIMLGCAAAGHFWLASGWLWILVSEQIAYGKPNVEISHDRERKI